MSNQLAIAKSSPLAPVENDMDIHTMGQCLAASNYFGATQAQAVTKILMGRELGIPAVASMTGIHVIEGKPSVGSNLIAQAIKRSGKYNYRVPESSDGKCTVDFYEDGELSGSITITYEQAEKAGWTRGKNGT